MKSVLGLLLLLFAAPSYGLESVCDATQDASVCYGSLGGPVMLQLMRNTAGYFLELWNEEGKPVLTIINGVTMRPTSRFPWGRWQVVAGNGTLIINPAERSDSGTYTVEIYRVSTLKLFGRHTVQLVVEVFISVWLAEMILLASLHLGSCYLQMRRKRTHNAGANQEVELSPASMSRSRRRRRGLEEEEEPIGDNDRESVIYESCE